MPPASAPPPSSCFARPWAPTALRLGTSERGTLLMKLPGIPRFSGTVSESRNHSKRSNVERWFEVGNRPIEVEAALARLKRRLLADNERQPYRCVAMGPGGLVRAKNGGFISSVGRLVFWPIEYSEHETLITKHELTLLLVKHCVLIAKLHPSVQIIRGQRVVRNSRTRHFSGLYRFRRVPEEVSKKHVYTINTGNLREPFLIRRLT